MTKKKDNQHYTPRMLLRGFTMSTKPKMSVRYKKGERVKEISIKSVASADRFYMTDEGDNSVDEGITEYENAELRYIIEELRLTADFGKVKIAKAKIEKAVLHLWARSRNFRDPLSETLDNFADESLKVFGSTEGLKNLFIDPENENVEDSIYTKFIEKMPAAASLPKAEVLSLVNKLFNKNPAIFDQVASAASEQLTAVKSMIQPTAKSSHIDFLTENTALPTERFKEYNWFLFEDTNSNIVFPDCVLLGHSDSDGFEPLLLSGKSIETVAMPISSSRLLIGTSSESCPMISDEHIGTIGKCSYEFFIFPEKRDELENLRPSIGELYSDLANDVVDTALSEYR